jgi:hypothetical protein
MHLMNKIIITEEGQTIIDIAVQHCGDVDRMMDIIENNNIITVNDITGVEVNLAYTLVPEQNIVLKSEWIKTKIVNELKQNIATAEI